MSGTYHEDIPLFLGHALAAGAIGDKATHPIPFKCDVVRAQVTWEGASAHATAAVVAFDKRPLAGSDVGRVDGALGVVKKVPSVAKAGVTTYAQPTTKLTAEVGDEVVVEVTTANGDALAFTATLIIRRIPETPANQPEMELTA